MNNLNTEKLEKDEQPKVIPVFNYLNWWVDSAILNYKDVNYSYNEHSKVYSLNVSKDFFFFFLLLNKKNTNTLNFFYSDITVVGNNYKNQYLINYQSIFYDFRVLILVNFFNQIISLTKINKGLTWSERELKEFNKVSISNLLDSRKLLTNYNHNNATAYNNFNNIVNDLFI